MASESGLAVLMFHGLVGEMPAYAVYHGQRTCLIRERDFERCLQWCTRQRRVISLAELPAYLAAGGREPAVLITFDDGLASVVDRGVPLLRHYGATAVVFVTTGWLDGGRTPVIFEIERDLWMRGTATLEVEAAGARYTATVTGRTDVARAVSDLWDWCFQHRVAPVALAAEAVAMNGAPWPGPTDPPSRDWWFPSEWSALRAAVQEGILEIGAHGHTHTPWAWLDAAGREAEITEPASRLRTELGVSVVACSYPHGLYDGAAQATARQEFRWAFTNTPAMWGTYADDARPRFHVPGERPVWMDGVLRWPLAGRVMRKVWPWT